MKGYLMFAAVLGVGYYLGTRGTFRPIITRFRGIATAAVTESSGAFPSTAGDDAPDTRAEEGPGG